MQEVGGSIPPGSTKIPETPPGTEAFFVSWKKNLVRGMRWTVMPY